MDITKIRLKGPVTIDLPIRGAKASDPYILKAADGLGPPEVSVFMGPGYSGTSVYQGRRPLDREIVLLLSLNPNYAAFQTVGSMRDHLYNFFTEEGFQVLMVEGDTEVCGALGYLKKVEINPFTSKPEVQLTISCAQSTFQFVGDAVPSLDVSTVGSAAPKIFNKGSAPAWCILEFTVTAAMNRWKLTQDKPGDYADEWTFDINHPMVVGDKVTIYSMPGQYLAFKVNGTNFATFVDLGPYITAASEWPRLQPGLNAFTVNNPGFNWNTIGIVYEWWGI